MVPFESPIDQMTVSALGALVVIVSLNGVLFWKMRRPSVVGVSALIRPLAVPPAVCVGVPHERVELLGVGVGVGVCVVA